MVIEISNYGFNDIENKLWFVNVHFIKRSTFNGKRKTTIILYDITWYNT